MSTKQRVEISIDKRLSLSIDEFAEHCGVCRDKVYAAIRTGQLKALKFGRRTIIPMDAARAFIDGLPQLTLSGDGEGRAA